MNIRNAPLHAVEAHACVPGVTVHSGSIRTGDTHTIVFDHYTRGAHRVIILAHGFYNNKDTYVFKEIARELSRLYDVISFDFRGHGKSSGLFSWTAREALDLRGIVEYAHVYGYTKIGVIGFSLGAAVALIEASGNPCIDAVIAISAPADFWHINCHFWEPEMLKDMKLNLGIKGKGKCVRPGNIFLPKIQPITVVHKISPRPVLFMHGANDWLIKPAHSKQLYAKAHEPKKLVIVPDAGHAEKIFDDVPEVFMAICREWLQEAM